jgi:amidohydrolase
VQDAGRGIGDEIDRLAKSLEGELVAFRRDLHAHPELARQEHRTTAAVVDRLRAAGLSPRVLPSGTGVVCDVIGSAGEPPSVGFRGDMDALAVEDRTAAPYRSLMPGMCHACGHDAHTALALGTALVLAELAGSGQLTRSARVIFQPAEETLPGGALDVIASGALEPLRQVFAFHCDPSLPVGQIGFRAGPITAGAKAITVTLTGPGGHTARPHLTADLVYALGSLVTDLPGALSRLTDPRAGLSVVWGQVHAGTNANAIPRQGFAEGTIRCLDADVWRSVPEFVPDLVQALMSPYRLQVDVDVNSEVSVPPCVNDSGAVFLAREAALDVVGPEGAVATDQSLGGEDFAWIADARPSALLRLGVRGPGVGVTGDLHQGTFDLDEAAIAIGVRVFARLADTLPEQ